MSESHHHRRAHSDDTFGLSNLDHMLNFDDQYDLNIFNFPSPLHNTPNDDTVATAATTLSMPNDHNSRPNGPPGSPTGSLRSFSFDDIGLGLNRRENERNERKKALTTNELAELTIVDPSRAKRIVANRKSAALSKERKNHFANELEMKVQTLRTQATNVSAQVTMLQRDTTWLSVANKELKMRIEALHQQARLRDAMNELLGKNCSVLRHKIARIMLSETQPEPIMPPSYSDQPFNAQLSGPSCDFSYFNQQS